jgi:hypothetical protein
VLQPVFSFAVSIARRLTIAARNGMLWTVVFVLTIVLAAVINVVSLGVLPTAVMALFTYAAMLVGTYSAVSMRTQGNAMAIGACALAIGLVLLVAISGHLYFLEGSGDGPLAS